ncbi:hypothetical protein E2562_002039 [Oryza meyeriana var. granulata]|uniref:Uncharacterized protein n=1 Tax=Oryza meyeriana var. granulata TaxID=110450 RepID=A0A6G1ECE6_9ORYZ|nr:hypothetical protein E2562_002039 [Oryza meyeriana var. granulata]
MYLVMSRSGDPINQGKWQSDGLLEQYTKQRVVVAAFGQAGEVDQHAAAAEGALVQQQQYTAGEHMPRKAAKSGHCDSPRPNAIPDQVCRCHDRRKARGGEGGSGDHAPVGQRGVRDAIPRAWRGGGVD